MFYSHKNIILMQGYVKEPIYIYIYVYVYIYICIYIYIYVCVTVLKALVTQLPKGDVGTAVSLLNFLFDGCLLGQVTH